MQRMLMHLQSQYVLDLKCCPYVIVHKGNLLFTDVWETEINMLSCDAYGTIFVSKAHV